MFLYLEGVLIYLLIGIAVMRMVVDFVPLDKFNPKKKKEQN